MTSPPFTFFILGAAKSGTTSLHSYLNMHPAISMAKVKETNFFVDRARRINTRQALDAQFSRSAETVLRGDSSHLHLSSPECAARIREACPDARFVVLLRDPAERAHSLYLHNRRNGSEVAKTFEQALTLETKRSSSDRFQRRCRIHPDIFRYVESGNYEEQLERYIELFPKDRFHIRTFEEFFADPENSLLEVHRFLGVEQSPLMNYPNWLPSSAVPRLAHVASRIHQPYSPASSLRVRVARELRRPKISLPTMSPVTRRDLRQRFQPSVERLGLMLGRPPMWWLGETEDRMDT
jgi:hypothetical protein